MSAGLARRRTAAALAVLAAHVALVLVGWRGQVVMRPVNEVSTQAPVVTLLRLLPDPVQRSVRKEADSSAPSATPSAAMSPAVTAPARTSPSRGRSGVSKPVEPAPVVLIAEPQAAPAAANSSAPIVPGHVGLDGSVADAPARAASGAAGPSAAGALVLAPSREVLRESFANPAVLDPRSNTPVPTFEERIALGMDPNLCLKVERLPDGSTRRSLVQRVTVPSAMQATNGVKTAPVRMCP